MKGELFCFHLSSADLQVISNTIYLNLEILAVIELIFIIEFMLLLGREKWHKILSFLSDKKTR